MADAGANASTESPETLARTAMESSSLYGFLATVFRQQPSATLLRRIKSPECHDALSEAGVNVASLQRPEQQMLEDMAVEYTGLFSGPGGHIPPYESVHVEGGGGALWGPQTGAVQRYIEAAGFQYEPEFHGLPDHISVELEFMSAIARQEVDAWRSRDLGKAINCLEFEQEFLTQHLGNWAPIFCEKVAERAEHPFYRDMAKLTAEFIGTEKEGIRKRSSIAAAWASGD